MTRPARGGRRYGAPRHGSHYLPIVLVMLGGAALTLLWPPTLQVLGWPVTYWVVGGYLLTSLAAFVAYAIDKAAARAGRRRISEATLLLLGLIGGWPGAIVAQQTLRHKTQKAGFRRAFWVSVLVNVVMLSVLATPLAETFFTAMVRPL
ncbi:MAG: DUF1294 domain-containing protein [Cryobacterium sp.]